ncbi:hypothetical protein ABQD63_04260 [Lactococcus garvieae]|uniref:hypothetical protein n=1 Tax=Lactococcus TaxID=1357 RepID=UPI0032E4BD0A
MKEFMDAIFEGVRQGANERVEESFNAGFNRAASITFDELGTYIDNIHSKYSKEIPLDKYDQYTLSELEKLKKTLASKFESVD